MVGPLVTTTDTPPEQLLGTDHDGLGQGKTQPLNEGPHHTKEEQLKCPRCGNTRFDVYLNAERMIARCNCGDRFESCPCRCADDK